MKHRERFLSVFQFKTVDRVCDYKFGYWTETIDRWHREGLPLERRTNRDVELYLGLEGWDCCEWLPIRGGLWPTLPEKILEEREKFGRQVLLLGGVDKLALIEGEKAIAKKFSRLTPLRARANSIIDLKWFLFHFVPNSVIST